MKHDFSEKKNQKIKKTKSNKYFAPLTLEAQEYVKKLQEMHENDIIAFNMSAKNFLVNDLIKMEVSISKEKKGCLVCKGKTGKFNIYLCTECEAFYCAKCANALIELENSCWVCGGAIDESKRTKSFI